MILSKQIVKLKKSLPGKVYSGEESLVDGQTSDSEGTMCQLGNNGSALYPHLAPRVGARKFA